VVECAVDVVGALECVEMAGAECFFTAGPADKVFCLWGGEGFYVEEAGLLVDLMRL
jgi:hypothetical protein